MSRCGQCSEPHALRRLCASRADTDGGGATVSLVVSTVPGGSCGLLEGWAWRASWGRRSGPEPGDELAGFCSDRGGPSYTVGLARGGSSLSWRSPAGWHAQREAAPALRKVEVSQEAHAEQHFIADELFAHAPANALERERPEAHFIEYDQVTGVLSNET